jgi:hypothetical protein
MKQFNDLQLLYFKKKGRVTILEATMTAFQRMPEKFSGLDLHRQAAREMMRPSVYPDSVLRCLRLLKKRKQIQFYCLDQVNSIYCKGLKV